MPSEYIRTHASTRECPRIIYFSGDAWSRPSSDPKEFGLTFEDEIGRVYEYPASELCSDIHEAIEGGPPLDLFVLRLPGASGAARRLAEMMVSQGVARAVVIETASIPDEESMTFAGKLFSNLSQKMELWRACRKAALGRVIEFQVVSSQELVFSDLFHGAPINVDGRPRGYLPPAGLFLGRERQLLSLAGEFGKKGCQITIVSGIPGIGKSTLVMEAAHRAAWRFPGGVTTQPPQANVKPTARSSVEAVLFGDLARGLGIVVRPEQIPEQVLLTHCQHSATLFVLDDISALLDSKSVSTAKRFMSFVAGLPETSHIIITNRTNPPLLMDILKKRPARNFPLHEGLDDIAGPALVQECAREIGLDPDDKVAAQIASAAHGHPLIISMAVRKASIQPWDEVLLGLVSLEDDTSRMLSNYIAEAIQRLGFDGRQGVQILTLFPARSCNAPALRLNHSINVFKSLQELQREGLVGYRHKAQRYFWHARVVECVSEQFIEPDLRAERGALASYYVARLEERRRTKTLYEYDDADIANVLGLIGQTRRTDALEIIAELACQIDPVLHVTGRWADSLRMLEGLLEHCVSAEVHVDSAKLLNRLACVYQARNKYDSAINFYNQARTRLTGHTGVMDMNAATRRVLAGTLHGLGRVQQDKSDPKKAKALYIESRDIYSALEDHDGVARIDHELGRLARHKYDFKAAEKLFEAAKSTRENVTGEEWDLAATLHELGSLIQLMGDNASAKSLFLQSLDIRKRLPDKRGVADTLHALGSIYQEERNLPSARDAYEESQSIKHGLADIRGTAATKAKLAELAILETRDFAQAEKLYSEAVRDQRQVDRDGLVVTYRSMGLYLGELRNEVDVAIKFYRQALDFAPSIDDDFGKALTQLELGRLLCAVQAGSAEGVQLLADAECFLRRGEGRWAEHALRLLNEAKKRII